MSKKQILTILAMTLYTIAIAQEELKLKLDSIAKSGLEKGIPGMQVLISDGEGYTIYNYGYHEIGETTEVNDSTNWVQYLKQKEDERR
jgi:hypothetical protein